MLKYVMETRKNEGNKCMLKYLCGFIGVKWESNAVLAASCNIFQVGCSPFYAITLGDVLVKVTDHKWLTFELKMWISPI